MALSALGLFLTAFLAATILPFSSELALGGLVANDPDGRWIYFTAATLGNVLGACVNWWLGRFAVRFKDHKYFPVKGEALIRASRWFQKWGIGSLLFAWVPIIGDPLTLAAGIFRVRFSLFLILVTVSKVSRYLLLVTLI